MAPSQILRDTVYMRFVRTVEMDTVASLEREGYPEDEAASMETLLHCKRSAPAAFLVALKLGGNFQKGPLGPLPEPGRPESVIGYVAGSLAAAGRLTQESMHTHEPQGEMYCIHSVCVDPQYRNMGLAEWMLHCWQAHKMWLPNLLPQVRTRSLICKADQIGLFMSAGFELVGPSEIVRGMSQWYEMRQAL